MTSSIKTLFSLLLALAFLAGCNGAARDAAKSRAAAYDKQAADLYRQAEAFVKNLKPTDRSKRRKRG